MAQIVESSDRNSVDGRGIDSWRSALDKLDGLYETASQAAVFAAPVSAEGRTVISVAEVFAGVGFGGGGANNIGGAPADGDPDSVERRGDAGGAGGGGVAQSRPVAVIVIDSDGVQVQPVIDVTKLAIAGITAFGSMLFMLSRMWRVGGK